MKMKTMIVFLCLIAHSAFAASLEDVRILETAPGKDSLELKLQTKDGPKDSYFFVSIEKSDRAYSEKLALTDKKLKLGNEFKLDLDIPSFSAFPSGSFYRSEDVRFSGKDVRD